MKIFRLKVSKEKCKIMAFYKYRGVDGISTLEGETTILGSQNRPNLKICGSR